MPDDARFEGALARFGEAHREDPRTIDVDGVETPWSVHYHRRLLHWVLRFDPDASEALRLAAAAQHIRRWSVPRSDYEEGRRGYRAWRTELAKLHAREARVALAAEGYDEDVQARVASLIRKIGLARDPEVQLFEDAICMVFFELEYTDLASRHDDDKMIDILARTWGKMSEVGRAAALGMAGSLPDRERRLVERATAGAVDGS